MKPIYFPFTYISRPVIQALSACFRQTVVYQPSALRIPEEMHKWTESGVLDIRVPVKGREDKLAAILKDYENWTNLHHGGALDYFKARHDSVPFFDETSASQIRADIKGENRKSQSQDKSEDLLNARFFLHIAQDLDLQNNKLSRDLLLIEAMEQNFMNNLKGEDKIPQPETTAKGKFKIDDHGIYMTAERLEAWIHLGQYDQQASGLYITTSRSVFDELMDCAPEAEMLIGFDAVPVYESRTREIERWQDGLFKNLNTLLTNPWPLSTDEMFELPAANGYDKTVAIKFYVIAGEAPQKFFARCVDSASLSGEDEKTAGTIKNTLIGIIEF